MGGGGGGGGSGSESPFNAVSSNVLVSGRDSNVVVNATWDVSGTVPNCGRKDGDVSRGGVAGGGGLLLLLILVVLGESDILLWICVVLVECIFVAFLQSILMNEAITSVSEGRAFVRFETSF